MPSHYSTHPLSPPLLAGQGSSYLDTTLYTMAPALPNVPLPPCTDHDHAQAPLHPDDLMTSPPSLPRIHPVLSAALTVVRYDLGRDPQTIRMSSLSEYPLFPSYDPASSPSVSILYVRCEATGQTITIHTRNRAVTCLDLMMQLHYFFDTEMEREEWRDVGGAMRSAMKEAYERRTRYAYSASARMKRVDYLLGKTTFRRIVPQFGDSTWLLQTC